LIGCVDGAALTDANGEFDATSDGQILAPVGLVAVVGSGDYFPAINWIATPADGVSLYGPATTRRDIWVVPSALLTTWSGMLEGDPEFVEVLPLGVEDGVVGMVRRLADGAPIAGATVVPLEEEYDVVIRYLNEAGDGFDGTATGTSGMFVFVDSALNEEFDIEIDGEAQNVLSRSGTAVGAVFTLIFNVP